MPPSREKQVVGDSVIDPVRVKLIEAARADWITRLIDLSRRNNLLYFRPVPASSIEVPTDSSAMTDLLAGKAVAAQTLLRDIEDRPGRVLTIARKAQENSEEKGLQTLYLAFGFVTWKVGDGGRDAKAPVFLLPVQMRRKGRELTAVEVQIVGDVKINPVLLHFLSDEFDIDLSEEALTECVTPMEPEEDSSPTNADDHSTLSLYRAALASLSKPLGKIPGFGMDTSAAISNFSFAKLALVNDLKEAGALLTANDVVAAIAGNNEARAKLGSSQIEIDPLRLDATPPEREFCVVEADSSQQCAIAGIAAGQNAVIHGPPGTGKSQTITNLIATLVANGKKVLFVAEKRAALEVVQQRLEQCGLDHLAMDLHGAELSPKKVMERVARTLNVVRSSKVVESEAVHRQFQDRRAKLNAHDAEMHTVSERTGKTVYEIQGALLRLPVDARTTVRWRGPELALLTSIKVEKIHDLLHEAAPFESLFVRDDPSPWTDLDFRTAQEVQNAVDLAQRLSRESLPLLNNLILELQGTTKLAVPVRWTDLAAVLALLSAVRDALEQYELEVFTSDITALIQDLDVAKSGGLRALWLSWTNYGVKAALRTVAVLRRGRKVGVTQGRKELESIEALGKQWTALSGGSSTPSLCVGLPVLEAASSVARRELEELQAIAHKAGWEKLSFKEVSEQIEPFAADTLTPYRMLSLCGIEGNLRSHGVQRLIEDFRQRKCPAALWSSNFDHAWLSSTLDEMVVKNPSIRGFVGATHGLYVEEFKKLDGDCLKLAKDRVRRAHAERTISVMNEHPDQEAMIKQEAAKMRRFKPLRKIFQEGCDVMTSVCPCWMASPLSVAQLIHPDVKFDYVIFDEASQILPEDAIPAIMRGKYVIVAGDNKQLPPTGFFASAIDDEDNKTEVGGYESLLDMMLPFARGFHLNWRYRSRDESLIAFSNHWMYDDRLVTFPGVGGPPAVTHVLVDYFPQGDGQEESSSAEVQRVIDLVLQHAHEKPDKSLGVITMGIKHAMRVQGALDLVQSRHPELAEFFDPGRPDRFFIKNLERVQGDERDCIILSVGYGKDRAGNLPLRFGPILAAGGMRRLNVAVTRARESMTVVSSFAHTDIDTTKVREGTGLEFLRNYLQYASSKGTIFSHGEVTGEPMNDFEADVYEALTSRGLKLVPQVGCSTFRIDFGVCHPTEPGRFVLAIEADGATYHSSYTARDRDRLRQQMLENLGWSFHRIWSTDWFHRRHEEIEGALDAYMKALMKTEERVGRPSVPLTVQEMVPELPMHELSGERSSIYPPIPKRANIGEYTTGELRALFNWVQSDGQLRTHDELADQMFAALPFTRRGSKIEAALRDTIKACESVRTRN